jgi:hypothetical protein
MRFEKQTYLSALMEFFIFTTALASISVGATNLASFENEVNAAWTATNYSMIKQAITNRLALCTNDILAKGLMFEYYFSIEPDYSLGQKAASQLITAVSNRIPAEVAEKREPLGLPMAVLQMTTSSNYPTFTPERMEYLHSTYPDAFPHIILYQVLSGRIEAIENGEFIWGEGFVEP